MTMKLNAVERRSRELLLTQGAAMSGAAVALSGLSTRLEGLVDQLISSYNISVKDLEVNIYIIYHNNTDCMSLIIAFLVIYVRKFLIISKCSFSKQGRYIS